MTDRPVLLAGVDVGSTNCKVGVYTAAGERVAQQRRPTGRDAAELVAGVLEDLTACVERAGAPPEAVGITGMAETGVALDDELRPMLPMLRWDDPRGGEDAGTIEELLGRAALFDATGVRLAAKTPLARWLGLRRRRPEVHEGMRIWVGAADLVACALTGEPVTDPTLAGRTGAFNQHTGAWDEDLAAAAGLGPERLPRVATGVAGRVAGDSGGLRAGTPVVVAGHDHLVASWAAGARAPGVTVDSMGTAEAVLTLTETPPGRSAMARGMSWNRYVDGAHWALVSGFPGSGRLAWWASDRLLGTPGPAAFHRLVREVPRPTGIVVQPYLSGRAAPAPDPTRRMTLHGVTAAHGPADLAVAVLEGACFQVRWMAEDQAEIHGMAPGTGLVLGGPSRNETWMRIKGDVLPGPARLCAVADAAVVGSALLAGRALGLDPDVLPSLALPRDTDRAARYQKIYTDDFLREATR
ncbi:MAG TPA: FGGY family carbohydrate kinase [Actinophytocola sp.]|uniref:FGGY-family carbohydrate kinase n=1 Tax=Actinophytocola sp. TaxID=1872138 RepID=UPI002DB6CD4F|nr:FGGY family carbohydrate kinase [Actinophytocola sp.]HEU5475528.1 FGGY family carbohydrate kinase [Actinophytocola sp.]